MKKLLSILFILIPTILISQVSDVSITWIDNDSTCYFKHAYYKNEQKPIPVFSRVLPWKSKYTLPEVSLKKYSSEPLKEKYNDQIDQTNLGPEPELDYSLVFENREAKLLVNITPFFINARGQTERLTNFEINTDPVAKIAKLKAERREPFANASVLASGRWYKIAVTETGIHKISYEQLQNLGINNPANTKIYGAGALLLPEKFNQGAYDDLAEIPVYINNGNDNVFGPGDYLLFYAQGIVNWSYNSSESFFNQQIHPYSLKGYYFLSETGSPSSPGSADLSAEDPSVISGSYDILSYYELENFNLLKSGREWYSDHFKLSLNKAIPFTLTGLDQSKDVRIKVQAAGRSNESSEMKVSANGNSLGSLSFSRVNLSSFSSTFGTSDSEIFNYPLKNDVLLIELDYLPPDGNSEAWLDYVTVNARGPIRFSGSQLKFRDSRSVGFDTITEFSVSNPVSNMQVWDVTDPTHPLEVNYTLSGNKAIFRLKTETLREFIAFNPEGSFPEPEFEGDGLGLIENQNLHGSTPPDLLIISNELFMVQAERLAEHRRNKDGLDVMTVSQEMVFNEFSSGTPDVSAIRNYMKMYYDNFPEEDMTSYLLLFGDGSYDNRDTARQNPNLILTYQSLNSLVPTNSFVSDDYFGLLDTGEDLYDGLLDAGIGRLPVSTVEEAELMVDKLIAYDNVETLGEWRNYICLIGDDEDGNTHMNQANSLATYIENNYPSYNINKIFLDAYPQETTPTGDRYPDVTRAINDQMNRGALIVNYTGHGATTGLAHEKILELADIKSWNNKGKYPLFLTATCEFSRYDEYNFSKKSEETSAGEEALLNPEGGSIALFTTTRLVYSGPNHVLNEQFYEIIFEKKEDGSCYRLGDVIKYSKNNTGAGINKRNFTLLGDPSMSLSLPRYLVHTDSINHKSADQLSDTINALDFVTVSGHIEDLHGNFLDTLNGTVIPIVYDKMKNLETLANDGGEPMKFQIRNNILYKGNVSLNNGYFSFNFYVPKDISYNVGEGKISYYAYSGYNDAHGSNENITIGGLGDFTDLDTIGPSIKVFMNDSLFRNGGIVDPDPELLIYMKDPYGINTTGNGIGHDITATLDEDRFNSLILNEYYVADVDSYSSGSVRYPYKNLPEGKHTIKVKVWDILNNSASKKIDFLVVDSYEMLLENIYTFPNPFRDMTWFNIEHNRPDTDMEVVLRIYDMRGKLVSVIQKMIYSSGYRIDPISWQGVTMGGASLGGGIYLYKVVVRTNEGEEASGSGRLIIRR